MKKSMCVLLVFVFLCLCGCNGKGDEQTVMQDGTQLSTQNSGNETEMSSDGETSSETETQATTENVSNVQKETKPSGKSSTAAPAVTVKQHDEMVGMWVTCFELSMKNEQGGSELSFENKVNNIFSHAVSMGVNTVIVQVRGYSDAWYKSSYFPWSYYITGVQGEYPGYDPLEIMVKVAHSKGLEIEAWINPYRVAASQNAVLADNNPAKAWLNQSSDNVFTCSKGIYYNPTSSEVQQLLLNGIREIVTNYDVDGIHIDDYFYPTKDATVDSANYQSYKSAGGTLSLDDFRRQNVSAFVSGMYSVVKSIKPKVRVGVSPQADMQKDYADMYADVYLWCSKSGYIDYIAPQIYFALRHKTMPFEQTLQKWESMASCSSVRVIAGLAPYKSGKTDAYAGSGYTEEWINNSDILARELRCVRNSSRSSGVILFSYSYTVKSNINATAQKEMDNWLSEV